MAQKTALIVWGGWDGHQPEEVAGIFAGLLREEGYAVAYAAALTEHGSKHGVTHIHYPHYRQNGALLWLDKDKEAALTRILLYWGGSEL